MPQGVLARLFRTQKTCRPLNVARLVTYLILLMRLIALQVIKKGKQAGYSASHQTSCFLDLEAHVSAGEDETSEEEGNGMLPLYYMRL